MFTINKGYFENKDVFEILQSVGLTPKDTTKAVAMLELCNTLEDIALYADDLKAVCSDFKFENQNISEKQFAMNNEDMLVSDWLIQLALGNFEKEAGAIKIQPMQSKMFQKAVNGSSSIQVSSEAYETVVSRAIMKEVEAYTYARDLIPNKINLGAKKLTMPVLDQMVGAAWIESAAFKTKHSITGSAFGTENSTGEWQTLALKERTYKAFKLATKGFINDETEEDSIVLLTPILRQALVEAIADNINKAVMNGDGDGKCKGFLQLTNKAAINVTGKSLLAPATVKGIAGRDILRAKHSIDPKCRKNSKIVLIASQTAIADLEGDTKFEDASQVGLARASKLQGWVGNFYGIPVVEGQNEDFGWADDSVVKVGEVVAVLVAVRNFTYFEQREVSSEYNRNAESQRDEYFISTRMNMEQTRYPDKNAICVIKHA